MAILSATRPLRRIFLDYCACIVFQPDIRGSFWRHLVAQNGSCTIPLERSRSLLSNDIRFVQIGVRTEKIWLPEVGVSELFFRFFLAKIPAKRGKLPANQELHLVAGVAVFLTHLGSWIKSQRVRRNPCAKAVIREEKRIRFSTRFPYFSSAFARAVDVPPDVGFRRSWYHWKACATLSLKVLDLRETDLGLERYGLANRDHRSVFGSPESNFSIRISAKLGKILAIRELNAMSEHVLSLEVMKLQITLQ